MRRMMMKPRTSKRNRFARRSAGANIHHRPLNFQPLEDRRLLAVFTVTSNADAGEGTLRQAILGANDTPAADEIVFDSNLNGATIDLSTGELEITEPLTINASGLSRGITVDAQSTSRVFYIDDGDIGGLINVTLSGLTITGGRAVDSSPYYGFESDGAGIFSRENLVLTDCRVVGNTGYGISAEGGGIFNFQGNLTITGSVVSNNVITGNYARGAGISSADGDLTVIDSTVSGNYAVGAATSAGGIYAYTGDLTVESSTINSNSSSHRGGGILSNPYLAGLQTILTNSTISGNSSTYGGGLFDVFYQSNGRTDIQNSTITDNYALSGFGSGILSLPNALGAATNVVSSIVSGNAHNNDVSYTGGGNPFVSGGNNLIGYGNALAAFNNNDQTYVYDPGVLPLANNGGPTETHALLLTSPAVDRGSNPLGLAHDQRGAPFLRQDIVFPVDVGAFEWQTAAFPLIVDTPADELDDDYTPGDLSLREAINAANGFIGFDVIGFDTAGVFAAPQTIDLAHGQLDITDSVEIVGPGADRLAIDAQGNSRVFEIDDGFFGADTYVTMTGLTITGGRVTSDFEDGGGIFNRENLTLIGSNMSGNLAAGLYADGGAIYNSVAGNLTIADSTIANNTAAFRGGGLFNNTYSAVDQTTIVNSTISGNVADMFGGGLFNRGGFMVIQSSTITNNQADIGGGSGVASLANVYALTEVLSSIISGNAHQSDVDYVDGAVNTFASGGYNLIGEGNALAAFTNNDQTYVNSPRLAPLADNGGRTLTHALLPGSGAIDRGHPIYVPSEFDQRGAPFARVHNGRVDVGAFELIDGDFDDNGVYSCVDIDALVAEIFAGTNNPSYDLNSDLLVNLDDLATWLGVAGVANLPSHNPYLFGDANLDGFVDGQDFIVWNGNKFTNHPAWCSGDFNADGFVDGQDFVIWNGNKFQSSNFVLPDPRDGARESRPSERQVIIRGNNLAGRVESYQRKPGPSGESMRHLRHGVDLGKTHAGGNQHLILGKTAGA